MKRLEEALWADYESLGQIMSVMDKDDERKKELLEERDKIRNELIKYHQSSNELKMKQDEIKAENDREKVRNRISILTFSISTTISLYAIIKTFNFDQESTITSTLGRGILNGVIPKLFNKR